MYIHLTRKVQVRFQKRKRLAYGMIYTIQPVFLYLGPFPRDGHGWVWRGEVPGNFHEVAILYPFPYWSLASLLKAVIEREKKS
jgi:hypothetical protein